MSITHSPQLHAQRKRYQQRLQGCQQENVATATYNCPRCRQQLHAVQPPADIGPWHSTLNCPYCGQPHERLVYNNGQVLQRTQSQTP
ncbi:hypothetical protein [Spongiibacter sp. UBA1325]|uniref:hypothetical protein n=1 Tax=Spongiibacter sp. UBA1325 TaxID=1947543 RepID=UPI00257DAFAA|nr:hypothetical protein [Spongiibacter sp. UBA1325]|tara:strand:- start:5430 stop:5690 length:261 start_codon:yes stop_codon:yes gene_type:complete